MVMGILLLMSSSGVLIYHTYCACTGDERVTVYVTPANCEEDYHTHHAHDTEGEEIVVASHECHDCSAHTDDCGCNRPEVIFVKLDQQLFKVSVRTEKVEPVRLHIPVYLTPSLFSVMNYHQEPVRKIVDPPPRILTAVDFLIAVQQLKIPSAT
jgi:hypothetical protein